VKSFNKSVAEKKEEISAVISNSDMSYVGESTSVSFSSLYKTIQSSLQEEYLSFSRNDVVGKGSTATIYKGLYHEELKVAIKCIPSSNIVAEEFSRSIELLKRLIHPKVIVFYGSIVKNDELLLVFELAESSLEQAILNNKDDVTKALSLGQKYNIAKEIAQGMAFLQDNNIIHLDLNPKNILMTPDFHVKLSDFDYSITLKDDLVFSFYGTPLYTAPEVIIHKKPEISTDIYSFGMILFFIFTGNFPLENNPRVKSVEDIMNFLMDLKSKSDTVASALSMDLISSPRLRDIISRCCKIEPEQRYQRFVEFVTGKQIDVDIFTEIYSDERFIGNTVYQQASKFIWTSHSDQIPFETFLGNFFSYYKVEEGTEAEWKTELLERILRVPKLEKEIPNVSEIYVRRFYNLFGDLLKPGVDPLKKLREIIFGEDWYFGDIEDIESTTELLAAVAAAMEKKKKHNYYLVRQGLTNLDSFTVAICLYNDPLAVKKVSILDLKQLLDQVKQLDLKKFKIVKSNYRSYNFLRQKKKKTGTGRKEKDQDKEKS